MRGCDRPQSKSVTNTRSHGDHIPRTLWRIVDTKTFAAMDPKDGISRLEENAACREPFA